MIGMMKMILKETTQNVVASIKEFICSEKGTDMILIILIILMGIFILYIVNKDDKYIRY